jgi:hypothetical protein
MKLSQPLASLVAVASSSDAGQALAQAAPYPGEDPAELFGYEIDTSETAEEVKMVFGANRSHSVALKQDSVDMVAPELARRETDVSRLQAAIESSALFYTAMRSEGVAASDVIGAELADAESGLSSEKRVTIYLAP